METPQNAIALAEDPIEKLKTPIFSQAVNANPVALAVLGWITEMPLTEPAISELRVTSDDFVMIRHTDETTAQLFCSLSDFLGQTRQLCVELGLTAEQADQVVSLVTERLR